ncbi:hypothetical protein B296_00027801 [Ensete ventricosum]|uniref:Uncharacterized protein n=1 Tax=Ensete ventricosum TaxID=4639 RepID=A0A426ZAX8_ENSVE|nr:hypothetical protein B296_00027801 [Ensete ventricosum]
MNKKVILMMVKVMALRVDVVVVVDNHDTLVPSNEAFAWMPEEEEVRHLHRFASSSAALHLLLAIQSDPLQSGEVDSKAGRQPRYWAGAYTSFARRLKLESSKQARIFAKLTRNLSLLIAHRPFLESATPLDETIVTLCRVRGVGTARFLCMRKFVRVSLQREWEVELKRSRRCALLGLVKVGTTAPEFISGQPKIPAQRLHRGGVPDVIPPTIKLIP